MIKITKFSGFNIEHMQLLGSGTQGRVYKIDSQRCIKVFKHKKACRDELQSLEIAQIDSHFPKLYDYGEDFIVRELIYGVELNKYLGIYPLTQDISSKILKLYYAMLRVGYNRLDTALFHIFVTPNGHFKLIDTSKALKKKAIFPTLIIKGLKELNLDKQFLYYVSSTNPELYMKWSYAFKSNKGK